MTSKLVSRWVVLTLLGMAGATVSGCGDRGTRADRAEDAATILVENGLGYGVGDPDALVTVVEFSDFGCPYCAMFARDSYPALRDEFITTGKVRWIFVPFVLGMFPNGDVAAGAAECAGEQQRFWFMHDLLFENQGEWRRGGVGADYFVDLAERAGIDRTRFERCLLEDRYAGRVEMQSRIGSEAGIRATPSFVIAGRLIEGAMAPAQFRTLLEFAVDAAR